MASLATVTRHLHFAHLQLRIWFFGFFWLERQHQLHCLLGSFVQSDARTVPQNDHSESMLGRHPDYRSVSAPRATVLDHVHAAIVAYHQSIAVLLARTDWTPDARSRELRDD